MSLADRNNSSQTLCIEKATIMKELHHVKLHAEMSLSKYIQEEENVKKSYDPSYLILSPSA